MLEKTALEIVKKKIKQINKEKNLEKKLDLMCQYKDSIRYEFNELLDELFAEIDLKPKKISYEDEFLN